jgi:hypothetical protein
VEDRVESRGIGDLLGDLGRQVSTLVRKEIDLARVEVTAGIGRLGRGAAMTGIGGAIVYAGVLVLLGAVVLGLIELGIDAWLAAALVAVVALVVGGLITGTGVKQLQHSDIAPEQTAETVRENVEFVKEQMK